jgi:hypothetical protein
MITPGKAGQCRRSHLIRITAIPARACGGDTGDVTSPALLHYPPYLHRKGRTMKSQSMPTVTTSPQKSPPHRPTVFTQTGECQITAGIDYARGREVGGSAIGDFNLAMIRRTMDVICIPASAGVNGVNETLNAAMAALAAFKPVDEIEGMIAAQAVALHFGAMECFRRSMLPAQHAEVASKLRRDGANLARGMTDMLEALDRKRGKGPQVVRVERVVVHEGGQAIVGNVAPNPGGGRG